MRYKKFFLRKNAAKVAGTLRRCSFLPSPLHLLTLFVVLLALANRRLGQSDAHHDRPFKAAGNGIVESVHVLGEEPLTDDPQTLDLFFAVGYQLCLSNGSG